MGAVLLLTVILHVCYLGHGAFALVAWIFSGTPLVISLIITASVKSRDSLLILLVSSIAYSIWFVYMWHEFTIGIKGCGLAALILFGIGPLSLPVMGPAWFFALVLNRDYAQKQEPQA